MGAWSFHGEVGDRGKPSLGDHSVVIRGTGSTRALTRGHTPRTPSALAAALGPSPGDSLPGSMVGLEHEYSLSVAGEPSDFRDIIHDLAIPGQRLDPGDRNAYRCPSGLVITCDAAEAEVVSPPLPVRPGFTVELAAWAEHGRGELSRVLPPDVTVTPFSTHLSASMPDDVVVAACDLFAHTFAPALMLILDGADSHGVFVRPRPGRVELCGEHAMGARLSAAAALVAGGARACAAALGADGDRHLPPLLAVDVRPATGRPGLFVGRRLAFGYDLCAASRQAPLPLLGGGLMAVQEHLALAWDAARSALGADTGDADLRFGDAMVFGPATLGVEGPGHDEVPRPARARAPSPFGAVLEPRRRPGFEATPEAATWDFTVFRLNGSARHGYACVPGGQLGRFLERLDAGLLDGLLGEFLSAPTTGRVLAAHHETTEAGLWDDAVIGPDLLPWERSAVEGDRDGLLSSLATDAMERISAAAPVIGIADVPGAPPPGEALWPAPPPVERPRRRRRRVGILVGAFLVFLVVTGAAAVTGMFAGEKPAGVDILTSPAAPSTSSNVAVEPSTTTPPEPTTIPELDTTTVLQVVPTSAPILPSTAVGALPTAPRPTTITTVPVVTTVPVDTTVQTTTTSASVPPTQFVVAVTSGILGCNFQPASASAVAGSTMRFRNETGDGIGISIAPPAGANTSISLDAGGTSGDYPLSGPGSYAVTCTLGGDSVVGRMTVTVTSP